MSLFSQSDRLAMLKAIGENEKISLLAAGVQVNCLFVNPGETVELFGGQVVAERPAVLLDENDVATLSPGPDVALLLNSVFYSISNIEKDGAGFALVSLAEF